MSSWLPVASLLLSATLWGLLWLPLRLLEGAGLHGLWTTLIIFGAPLCLGLLSLFRRRHELVMHPKRLLIFALANGWCNTAFILAVLDGNVVRVLLLFYLSPLWAVLLGKFILKEVLTPGARMTLILAMFGAMLMLWHPSLNVPWPQGPADWLAISSGFAFALSNVIVRWLHDISVPTKTIVSWWGCAFVAAAAIMALGRSAPDMTPGLLGGSMALGVFGITVMTLAVIYGVANMPIHRSAVILLFELVAGTVSSQLLTDEVVLLREWIGGVLIISAAWFAAHAHMRARDVPE